MKRFIGYRPNPPEDYVETGRANSPEEPQYEGIVFSDGTVVIRWLTEFKSHSIWPDFETFFQVHGHADYGTRIEWLDKTPALSEECERCNGTGKSRTWIPNLSDFLDCSFCGGIGKKS